VTLNTQQIPAHTHILNATRATATSPTITTTSILGTPTVGTPAPQFYVTQGLGPAPTVHPLASGVVGNAGGSLPHTNLMPSQCISFCIALVGIFPSQN
jgi:microcystin-dependent protein